MDGAEYNKKSSKELIELLRKFISKGEFPSENRKDIDDLMDYLSIIKAFSYEDGMKLQIINHKNNPFTLWANDIDCKIVLWAGKCEEIYGHNKKNVMGEDFLGETVDIVAKYERRKARIDCRDIIINGKQYNNIAHDKTHDGAERIFQTNCFKIKDFFDSNKYYSAEIGVITNSIAEQTEATEKAVEHERKIEALLEKICNIKKESLDCKKLATPTDKKKLQKIHNELSKLKTKHDEFEIECTKWVKYVEFCNDIELKVISCEDKFNKIKKYIVEKEALCDDKKITPKKIV